MPDAQGENHNLSAVMNRRPARMKDEAGAGDGALERLDKDLCPK